MTPEPDPLFDPVLDKAKKAAVGIALGWALFHCCLSVDVRPPEDPVAEVPPSAPRIAQLEAALVRCEVDEVEQLEALYDALVAEHERLLADHQALQDLHVESRTWGPTTEPYTCARELVLLEDWSPYWSDPAMRDASLMVDLYDQEEENAELMDEVGRFRMELLQARIDLGDCERQRRK